MYNKALLDSWYFFKNHLLSLSLIILPIVVPLEIFTSFYQYNFTSDEARIEEMLLPMSISILLYPIYSVAIVLYISSVISDTQFTVKKLYAYGFQYWLPYITITFFIGLIVIGGLALFIIPGIIFIIRYSFSEFELLLDGKKPLDAMSNSWKLTGNYMLTLFIGYSIISVCLYIPSILIYSSLEESSTLSYIVMPISNIIFSVLHTLYTIYAYRIYEYSKKMQQPQTNII